MNFVPETMGLFWGFFVAVVLVLGVFFSCFFGDGGGSLGAFLQAGNISHGRQRLTFIYHEFKHLHLRYLGLNSLL